MINLRTSVGLEDDSPQVEINFNVDTDKDGVPLTSTDNEGEQTVEEAKTETIEAEAEVEKTEDDVEELEEAQEALESIQTIVNNVRTISVEEYQLLGRVLSNITGEKTFIDVITTESDLTNPLHNALVSKQLVQTMLDSNHTASMEGVGDFFKKMKNALEKFFNLEKSVVKRANGLLQVAETRSGEHATSKTIPVNVKRGLNSKYLAHTEYTDKEIMVQLERTIKFFNSIKTPSLDKVDIKNLLHELFSLDENEWENKVSKHGRYKSYQFFAIEVARAHDLDVIIEPVNKSLDSLPVLTNDNVKTVLKGVLELHKLTPVLKQVVDELNIPYEENYSSTFNSKGGVDTTFTTKGDHSVALAREVSWVIYSLIKHRTKLMDELVNYCGMCIQDRGVDSPEN